MNGNITRMKYKAPKARNVLSKLFQTLTVGVNGKLFWFIKKKKM